MAKALLFLFLIFPALLFSQPFVDIVNVKYQRFPSVAYTANENKSMCIDQIVGNLNIPIQLKNKDVIITGGTYEQLNFQNSDGLRSNLYSFNLQLGYLKTWGQSKWKTLFILLPKISSDNLRISKDAYQQGGALLFTYVKKSNLKYKTGLYYNREFFGNFFMPLLGIEWKPNDKLNIFGVLPGNMNIEYQLNKHFYIGASYQSITSSYRLHESLTRYYVRNGDRFWGHNQLRVFVNFYTLKNLVLFAEAGYTFFRKFEMYEGRKEKMDHPMYHKTEDGLLINLGMAFRVRLKD